jgi:hypothetical protein
MVSAGGGGGDDGLCLTLSEALPEVVGVIAAICEELLEGAGRLDQGLGHGDVIGIAGAEQQNPGAAPVVDQAMDLGRPTAS